ncbi:MAG: hypothetical protein Q9187_004080 [Circinaria calcarea]
MSFNLWNEFVDDTGEPSENPWAKAVSSNGEFNGTDRTQTRPFGAMQSFQTTEGWNGSYSGQTEWRSSAFMNEVPPPRDIETNSSPGTETLWATSHSHTEELPPWPVSEDLSRMTRISPISSPCHGKAQDDDFGEFETPNLPEPFYETAQKDLPLNTYKEVLFDQMEKSQAGAISPLYSTMLSHQEDDPYSDIDKLDKPLRHQRLRSESQNADICSWGPPQVNKTDKSLTGFPPVWSRPLQSIDKSLDVSYGVGQFSQEVLEKALRGCIASLRVSARILAGRKVRWKRDSHLSQSMKIGPAQAGKKGGMKLTGVDKAETQREDQEVAEFVRTWKHRLGSIRAALATVNGQVSGSPLVLPEISERMVIHVAKASEGTKHHRTMGLAYNVYLNSDRIYGCKNCKTHLANHDSIISRVHAPLSPSNLHHPSSEPKKSTNLSPPHPQSFRGQHGKAFLFASVVNITQAEAVERSMTTGRHLVRDISCRQCKEMVGWKYDKAYEPNEKYKENKYILEEELLCSVY